MKVSSILLTTLISVKSGPTTTRHERECERESLQLSEVLRSGEVKGIEEGKSLVEGGEREQAVGVLGSERGQGQL